MLFDFSVAMLIYAGSVPGLILFLQSVPEKRMLNVSHKFVLMCYVDWGGI